MSIELSGNSRPGKPPLAALASGLLLVATLGGAAALTYVRNHPVSLAEAQDVPAVPGLRMAWPASWVPVSLPAEPGPVVTGMMESAGSGRPRKILYLLNERISDMYLSPSFAASHLLEAAGRQLGLVPAASEFLSSTGQMLGEPAFQIKYAAYFRQRVFWVVLRVATEPDGQAIGLLLLSSERMSPSVERTLDSVAETMQVRRSSLDVAAALQMLKLGTGAAGSDSLAPLRGYVREMPAIGPIGVTFVPQGQGSPDQYYGIDVWTSWLANRRTLQDLAGTWFRRAYLRLDPPAEGGWVQRGGSRIWKLVLAERHSDTDTLVDALYLRELPNRRVVWAHTTAGGGADPEGTVLDLLASVQPPEQPEWTYDQAVTTAGTILADIATGPVERYYRANNGRQEFVFTGVGGRQDGQGRTMTAVQSDGTVTRAEQVSINMGDLAIRSEKTSLLRADLSAFQVKDATQHGQLGQVRIDSSRPDAASPVSVVMQFARGAPVQASFLTHEPFLPDLATEPAAWYLARMPGTTALFRIVGSDPQVPESLLMTGLGRQTVEVAGRRIDAFACLLREDTSSGPFLILFEERGGLIGYVLQGGTSLLRPEASSRTQPAGEE